MLAYILWHRPYAGVERDRYEEAILNFQRELVRQAPPGLIGVASFRIEPVPWLGDRPGYEDWHLLQGSWAMDPLNAFAVAGRVQGPHDQAAAQMELGHGGVYVHAGGDITAAAHSAIRWLSRPRGIQWRPVIEAVRAQCREATIWRRQMVLGPAPEFAVEAPAKAQIAVPAEWQARRIARTRLPAAPD